MERTNLNIFLARIDEKKQKLDTLRPLPVELIKNVHDWMRIELTYTTNAIEGNTLTRQETALLLEHGIVAAGKKLREHFEAFNAARAYDYVNELAKKSRSDITLCDVLEVHRLVLASIDDAHAGVFRQTAVRIMGSHLVLPAAHKLDRLMDEFMCWFCSQEGHPVIIAARAHHKLVAIHPFIDGNGRAARFLMNLVLVQNGYPWSAIIPESRRAYLAALDKANEGDDSEWILFVADAVDKSLDMMLELAQQNIEK